MIKTGIDIVKISRIKKLIQDPTFVEKVFDETELIKKSPESLAGIFALKEAFFKATQIKIKKWNEVVVKYHNNGKPYLVYDKDLVDFEIKNMDCSISHAGEYAIGNVVVLTNSPN